MHNTYQEIKEHNRDWGFSEDLLSWSEFLMLKWWGRKLCVAGKYYRASYEAKLPWFWNETLSLLYRQKTAVRATLPPVQRYSFTVLYSCSSLLAPWRYAQAQQKALSCYSVLESHLLPPEDAVSHRGALSGKVWLVYCLLDHTKPQ